MKLLVIGGAGFLGANLVRRCLAESAATVTVFDSLDPLYGSSPECLEGLGERVTFIQGDIGDPDALAEVVTGQSVIFNCAGQTSHPLSMEKPLLDAEVNCLGNLTLLETVRQRNPQAVVVFASSSTVVGRTGSDLVDETHSERPSDIYSANKGVAEKYYQIFHEVYDLKTVSLRLPNLFGPYGKANPQFGFINYFISLANAGKPITVFGPGQQKRNVLFVEDAAEILWQASNAPQLFGATFFATGDEHPTVQEIAQEIDACFEGGGVETVDWPEKRRRIDVGNVELSSKRLREITGWHPRFTLKTGLQRTKDRLASSDGGATP